MAKKKFDSDIFMGAIRQLAGESCPGPDLAVLVNLAKLEGEEFLLRAYWTLLNREADPNGLAAYRSRSKNLSGRILVIVSLLLSPERVYLRPWQRNLLKICGRLLPRR